MRKSGLSCLGILATLLFVAPAGAAATEIRIGYLHAELSKARISLMDVPAENDGLAGAEVAVEDNNTTGRFVNQHYALDRKDAASRRRRRARRSARSPTPAPSF